jgi:uncharacterized protein with PIN domain
VVGIGGSLTTNRKVTMTTIEDRIQTAAVILQGVLNEETDGDGLMDCVQAAHSVLIGTITTKEALEVLERYQLEEFKEVETGE